MANRHGTILAKERRDSYRSPISLTIPQRTTMPTVRRWTGITIRTGNRGTTILQLDPEPIQQVMQQPSYNGPPDMSKTIHLGSQSPRHLRDFWAVIIDTGAAISVCPTTFCEHIKVIPMGDEAKKQYVAVTGEGLTIHGWKHVTILVGRISLQISFVVANVQSALLGLPDLNKNK
eukprot:279052-Amphidinium_carterae.1